MAMPAKYETPVGDMESNLSREDNARCSRALYRLPKVYLSTRYVASGHLGAEADVNSFIKSLSLLRVLIAHRPETIRLADAIDGFPPKRPRDFVGPA